MAKIEGLDGLSQRMDQCALRTKKATRAVLFTGANQIEAEARRLITTGSTSGANHVPSAPGEPPNADTRNLDRNITAILVSDEEARVVSAADYSAALEYGAPSRNLAPRPFLRPARDARAKAIVKLFREAVRKANR